MSPNPNVDNSMAGQHKEHDMQLVTYLAFDGNCEAAFKFYAKCLGGAVTAMHKFGGSPMASHVPPECMDKIMHGRLEVGNSVLMGSDSMPQHPYEGVKGCSVSINVNDVAEAERVFAALSENAKVMMPIQKTFWAARFGMLIDQFGVPWMVNCEAAA